MILFTTISCGNTSSQNNNITTEVVIDTIVKDKPIVNESGTNVKDRFNTPDGFTRVKSEGGSWGSYLQNLPLKPHGSQVYHFDGTLKYNTSAYCAVVDLPAPLIPLTIRTSEFFAMPISCYTCQASNISPVCMSIFKGKSSLFI